MYNPSILQVVKVADFGVARVKAQSGVMTAETGTYRWMAPEVLSLTYFLTYILPAISIELGAQFFFNINECTRLKC